MYKTEYELIGILEKLLENPENEYVEFKEAKDKFDIDKLGQYFSAISNEATLKEKSFGWIVFGIHDKNHAVLGTNYCLSNDFNKIKKQIAEHTTDNVTFYEIYVFEYNDKRIIMFQVPAAIGIPVKWKKIAYGRDGETLTVLNDIKSDKIKFTASCDWQEKLLMTQQLMI